MPPCIGSFTAALRRSARTSSGRHNPCTSKPASSSVLATPGGPRPVNIPLTMTTCEGEGYACFRLHLSKWRQAPVRMKNWHSSRLSCNRNNCSRYKHGDFCRLRVREDHNAPGTSIKPQQSTAHFTASISEFAYTCGYYRLNSKHSCVIVCSHTESFPNLGTATNNQRQMLEPTYCVRLCLSQKNSCGWQLNGNVKRIVCGAVLLHRARANSFLDP